MPGFHIIIRSA